MKRFAGVLVASIAMSGCVTNPGVIKTGPHTYMISQTGHTGFASITGLREKALKQANAFCAKKGEVAQMTGTSQSSGIPILGNFPRADIEFICVSNDAKSS